MWPFKRKRYYKEDWDIVIGTPITHIECGVTVGYGLRLLLGNKKTGTLKKIQLGTWFCGYGHKLDLIYATMSKYGIHLEYDGDKNSAFIRLPSKPKK